MLLVRVDGDLAGPVSGDGEREGPGVDLGIVDPDVGGGPAADVVPPHAETVHEPGGRPADHPQFDEPGGLTRQTPGGILQADDGALAQGRADDGGGGIDGVSVHVHQGRVVGRRVPVLPERDDLRPAVPDLLGELLGDVPHGGLRIGIEHDVGGGTAVRVDDGQSQAHDLSSPCHWAGVAAVVSLAAPAPVTCHFPSLGPQR